VSEVVFALPAGAGWPLPLYELALLTARHLTQHGIDGVTLTVATHEDMPLGLFGQRAASRVEELLEQRGIGVLTGVHPSRLAGGRLHLVPGGQLVADRVVTVPRLEGPFLEGVPQDQHGFIPVDGHGAVRGLDDVYAAGDATNFPVKQGGLAAQQADAVAAAIAKWAGAPVDAAPFDPVLRGLLLTGDRPSFMRASLRGGQGETTALGEDALWWPPGKIAGRYLAPYLAAYARTELRPSPPDSGEEVAARMDPEPDGVAVP
jgi:sulfide:quinone oxidoreductase